jgi:predicted nucleic acid-binding protein
VAHITVIYDACVLYPAPLRDLLMQLALTDLFRACWTEDIQQEWIRSLLKKRPDLSEAQMNWTKAEMNRNVRGALVTGYESLIPALVLPDPDDRHVLAAAIRANASIIITTNLKDFPDEALAPYDVEVQHPDDFILYLLDRQPDRVCEAARIQRQRLRNPPMDVERYLKNLARQGLTQTVLSLREMGYWRDL